MIKNSKKQIRTGLSLLLVGLLIFQTPIKAGESSGSWFSLKNIAIAATTAFAGWKLYGCWNSYQKKQAQKQAMSKAVNATKKNYGLNPQSINISERSQGCFLGAAVGDMLGAQTEFVKTMDGIKQKFGPQGVTGVESLKPQDQKMYPYTDDTAMARLVMANLIASKNGGWPLDKTMAIMTRDFVVDMQQENGWAKPSRAPGGACLKSLKKIHNLSTNDLQQNRRWAAGASTNAGGCGSVMRAHPFGIVFYDDPEKAITWAAEHSDITHGADTTQMSEKVRGCKSSIARGACAALAGGVMVALNGNNYAVVADAMISVAQKYCSKTANKLRAVTSYAISHMAAGAQKDELLKTVHNKGIMHLPKKTDEEVFAKYEGWAADDAVAAGLYAFLRYPNEPKKAILLGVNTPGDSDSIASIAGALAGAYNGVQKIPADWIKHLEDNQNLRKLAKEVK